MTTLDQCIKMAFTSAAAIHSRDSSVVERRTHDRKVAGLKKFEVFLRGQIFVLTQIYVSDVRLPRVNAESRVKDPGCSAAKSTGGGRLQLNTLMHWPYACA